MNVVATVALDARDGAVLDAVAAIARRGPARVTLVHACERAPADRDVIETRMGALAERVRPAEVGIRVEAGMSEDVVDAVLGAEDPDLLVIGRSVSAGGEPAWGGHGKALLRGAGCPVLVVPADAVGARFGRAVVGMDLSPAALDALALAAGLCEGVEAVAVLAPEDAHARPDDVRADVSARFDALLTERGLGPVPLRTVLGKSPTDALLERAGSFDLIAVGSRGLSPLAAVFLGSTAERLAGRSPRPVLVVRRRGEARGLLGALFRP